MFFAYLIIPIALLVSLIYCKKKPSASSRVSQSGLYGQEVEPFGSPFTSDNGSQDDKKEDGPIVLDATLPAIEYLLTTEDKINDEWLGNVMILEERVQMYLWAMNKRIDADSNSWKALGNKISKFLSEGFFVQAGSEEAKQIRKNGEVENRITAEITRIKQASKENKEKKE